MVGDHDDDLTDLTSPTGVDQLIARPKLATGETGQIDRRGDHMPWWFVPGPCAVAFLPVGVLVVVADHLSSARVANPTAEVTTIPVAAAATTAVPDPDPEHATEAQPVATVAPPVDAGMTLDPRIDDLPPAGTVRISGSDREILARCEEHLPFDPADTEFQTSSYFFFDAWGISQPIDRVSTPDGELLRTAAPAFVIRNDGILSAPGVVSDGTNDLDITMDPGSTVGESDARPCWPSDRL